MQVTTLSIVITDRSNIREVKSRGN